MNTNPDPIRATTSSPTLRDPAATTLSQITQAHHQVHDNNLHRHHPEKLSAHRAGTDNSPQTININSTHSSDSTDQRTNHRQFAQDPPVNDSNTYTGRPVLDTSRRYSSGYLTNNKGNNQLNTTFNGSNLASRRQPKLGGQHSTLSSTPESPTADQIAVPSRTSASSLHTFAPDFNTVQEVDHHSSASSAPIPPSPAFSISSFTGILPSSTSISSIASSGQSKPPVLEYKYPITVKDFENIQILGPAQQTAIKTLCSSRVLSRIDTIGWYSIIGAQKFPTVVSSQDEYDIDVVTTCLAIEFGSNNMQTQNFNTL
ncbi:hypothetical protein BGZ76_002147, partial [Entomortierella beljakovae]